MSTVARRFPLLTWAVAAAIVVVAWQVTGFVPTRASIASAAWSRDALATRDWQKLLLSLFAHAGVLHLGFNLVALLSFGTAVERGVGRMWFAAVYLAAGIAGNFAHTVYGPDVPVVGASGAIFGLVGLLMMLAPGQWVIVLVVPLPILLAGALYTAAVLLLLHVTGVPSVAHEAHLGGMALGVAAAFAVHLRRAVLVLPAAGAVFASTWMGVSHVVALGPPRFLQVDRTDWLEVWGPLAGTAAVVAAAFVYLGWVDRRLGRDDA